MAGAIVANTINTDTGLFSTNNAYSGVSKAWVNFSCPSTTVTVNNSFNVSSVTRNAAGDYTINFTTSMPNIYYAVNANCSSTGTYSGLLVEINSTATGNAYFAPTTTATRITVIQPNVGYLDAQSICVSIQGS